MSYCPEHFFASTMFQKIKEATGKDEKGFTEKYLPWYGAATLGTLGHHAGEAAPKKYKLPAKLVGTVVGTGMGVHGGERLGKYFDVKRKKKTAALREKIVKKMTGKAFGWKPSAQPVQPMQQQQPQPIPAVKIAAEKKPSVPGTILAGLAGLGIGTAGGFGLGHAIEAVSRKQKIPMAKVLPYVGGAAGAGLGLLYPWYKGEEQEQIRRARQREK